MGLISRWKPIPDCKDRCQHQIPTQRELFRSAEESVIDATTFLEFEYPKANRSRLALIGELYRKSCGTRVGKPGTQSWHLHPWRVLHFKWCYLQSMLNYR